MLNIRIQYNLHWFPWFKSHIKCTQKTFCQFNLYYFTAISQSFRNYCHLFMTYYQGNFSLRNLYLVTSCIIMSVKFDSDTLWCVTIIKRVMDNHIRTKKSSKMNTFCSLWSKLYSSSKKMQNIWKLCRKNVFSFHLISRCRNHNSFHYSPSEPLSLPKISCSAFLCSVRLSALDERLLLERLPLDRLPLKTEERDF